MILPFQIITVSGGTPPLTYLHILQKWDAGTSAWVQVDTHTYTNTPPDPLPSNLYWDLTIYGEGTYRQYVKVTDAKHCSKTSNYSPSVEYLYEPFANVSITKTPNSEIYEKGGQLEYTIVVTNAGPDPATQIVVYENLPAGVSVVTATPTIGTFDLSNNQWSIPSLPLYGTATLVLSVDVDGGTPNNTVLNNAATVTAAEPNPDGTTQANASVTVVDPTAPNTAISGNSPTISDNGNCAENAPILYGFRVIVDNIVFLEQFGFPDLSVVNGLISDFFNALLTGESCPVSNYFALWADFEGNGMVPLEDYVDDINTANSYWLADINQMPITSAAPHNQNFSNIADINTWVAIQVTNANNPDVVAVHFNNAHAEFFIVRPVKYPCAGSFEFIPLSTDCAGNNIVIEGQSGTYTIAEAIITTTNGEPVPCDLAYMTSGVTVNGTVYNPADVSDLLAAYQTEYPDYTWQVMQGHCAGVVGYTDIANPPSVVDATIDMCDFLPPLSVSGISYKAANDANPTPCTAPVTQMLESKISIVGGSGVYEFIANTTSQNTSVAPSIGDTAEVLQCAGGTGTPIMSTAFPLDYQPPTSGWASFTNPSIINSSTLLGGNRRDFYYFIFRDVNCPTKKLHLRGMYDEEGYQQSWYQTSPDGINWSAEVSVLITT